MPERRSLLIVTTATLLATSLSATAHAGVLEVLPTRALGLGGALRGAAAATAGPTMNPSGISLTRSYVVEGLYQYLNAPGGHLTQVAIADSTSASNIGGGLTYTYATASPDGGGELGRHEVGLSLSLPLGDRLAIGGTGRYLRVWNPGVERRTGFTFDAGLTIRALDRVSLGLAARGLNDFKDAQAPATFAGGLAVSPTGELTLLADAILDRRTYVEGADAVFSFLGGAEYTWASRVAVRAGGGRDGVGEVGYGSLGVSILGESGALDFGGRMDFGGGDSNFIFGLSARLFVPAP
ncbi:MAG TPA: hypothetical protein VGG33_27040 [Polyangia bacterium]